MANLNIFDRPEFSMASLTTAINALPHKPKLLGALGLFQEVPIRTTTAKIEKREGKLSLLTTAARGTMRDARTQPQRVVRTFEVPHVPYYQTIKADDIQNVRAFGSETELESVSMVVNDQLQGMRNDHEATHEWHRLGAIKGVQYEPDESTVLYDFPDAFGESVNTPIALSGGAKVMADTAIRNVANALGNDTFDLLYALCGDSFFTALTTLAEVKDSYANADSNRWLRQAQLGPEYGPYANGFEWGGITWLNYRGQIGANPFIAPTEAWIVPSGVDQLYQAIMAPTDSMEAVNTRGQLMYASQERLPHGKGVELHTTSTVLWINTRPGTIQQLTET